MSKNLVKDLHKGICKYYLQTFGPSIAKLSEWRFNFVEVSTIKEIRKAVEKYDLDQIDENLLPDAFDELVAKGYLEKPDWGFNLTEEGLKAGTRGLFTSILLFLNKNPGVAIIVSIVALVVSVAPLVVGIV